MDLTSTQAAKVETTSTRSNMRGIPIAPRPCQPNAMAEQPQIVPQPSDLIQSQRSTKQNFESKDINTDDTGGKHARPNTSSGKRRSARKLGDCGRRFACPFFARNPSKYLMVRSCSGPGWDSVHRVKYVHRLHGCHASQAHPANIIGT